MNKIVKPNLFEETENLTKPKVWKSYIDDSINYNEAFIEVISEIQKQKNNPPLNINVNDAIKPWMKNHINDSNVRNYNDLENWFKAWLKEDNFCVLIDRITSYSETFFEMLTSKVIRNLGEQLDFNIGADSYAVFGNYGYTPFGIHQDSEPIFLIHCGPANKDIWYWTETPHEDFTDRTDILFNTSEWKNTAVHVVLEPGDMVFIPKNAYHLLYTPAFSITLGTALFPGDTSSLLHRGLANITPIQKENDTDSIFWSEKDTSISDQFETKIKESYGFNINEVGQAVLEGLINQYNKLQSNGGFIGSPSYDTNKYSLSSMIYYSVKKNTKIACKKQDEDLVLFLRGRIIKVRYDNRIEEAIEFINKSDKFSTEDISRILKDEGTANKLLEIFRTYRSVEFYS